MAEWLPTEAEMEKLHEHRTAYIESHQRIILRKLEQKRAECRKQMESAYIQTGIMPSPEPCVLRFFIWDSLGDHPRNEDPAIIRDLYNSGRMPNTTMKDVTWRYGVTQHKGIDIVINKL